MTDNRQALLSVGTRLHHPNWCSPRKIATKFTAERIATDTIAKIVRNLLNPSPRKLPATPEALATPSNMPPSGKRQTTSGRFGSSSKSERGSDQMALQQPTPRIQKPTANMIAETMYARTSCESNRVLGKRDANQAVSLNFRRARSCGRHPAVHVSDNFRQSELRRSRPPASNCGSRFAVGFRRPSLNGNGIDAPPDRRRLLGIFGPVGGVVLGNGWMILLRPRTTARGRTRTVTYHVSDGCHRDQPAPQSPRTSDLRRISDVLSVHAAARHLRRGGKDRACIHRVEPVAAAAELAAHLDRAALGEDRVDFVATE